MQPIGYDGIALRPAVAMGVVAAQIVLGNLRRKRLVLQNDGDNDLYLGTTTAVARNGVRLNAGGGSIVMEPDRLGRIYTGPVFGVTVAGATICLIWEEG